MQKHTCDCGVAAAAIVLVTQSYLAAAQHGQPTAPPKASPTDGSGSIQLDTEPADSRVFPRLARKMLQWPDDALLQGPKRVRNLQHAGVQRARKSSMRWTQTLIREKWLPTTPEYLADELVMIRDWDGPLDATFIRWEKNEYAVQVTQTPILIAIKLSPLGPVDAAKTLEDRKSYARQMCLEVLRDTCVLWQPEGKRWTGIHDQILDRSFSRALIKEVSGGVAAAPWSPYVSMTKGMTPKKNGSPSDARGYWWHYLGWHTDGKELGLWTYKERQSWKMPAFGLRDRCKEWF
jgi:hypothetical protein